MLNKIIKVFLISLNFSVFYASDVKITVTNKSGINCNLLLTYFYIGYSLDPSGPNINKDFPDGTAFHIYKISKEALNKKLYSISANVYNCDDPESKATFVLNRDQGCMTLHLVVKDKKLQFIDADKKSWQVILDSLKDESDSKEERKSVNKKLEPDG